MKNLSLDYTYLILGLVQRCKLLMAGIVSVLFTNGYPAPITLPGTFKTEKKNWLIDKYVNDQL